MAALRAFLQQLWDGASLRKAGQPLPCAGPGLESPLREGWLRRNSPCLLHLVLLNGVEPGSSVGKRLLDLAGLRWSGLRVTARKSRGPWPEEKLPFSLLPIPASRGLVWHGGWKAARPLTPQTHLPASPLRPHSLSSH